MLLLAELFVNIVDVFLTLDCFVVKTVKIATINDIIFINITILFRDLFKNQISWLYRLIQEQIKNSIICSNLDHILIIIKFPAPASLAFRFDQSLIMGAKEHHYSFKDVFRFVGRSFCEIVDLIDRHSAWNAKDELEQFNIWNFVSPPVDRDTNNVRKWFFNVRNFRALSVAAVGRIIDANVFRLLIDCHISSEKFTCNLFKTVTVITFTYYRLKLLNYGISIQYYHIRVIMQFLQLISIWLTLT